MVNAGGPIPAEAREIIQEEEALLARALASLAAAREAAPARARRGELRSVQGLRELREEAAAASEDDLPALLLEMSVRHRLLERPDEAPPPDPASPYMAHLRVREGGAARDYLLGRASFLDPASGVRIVDWRVAPVARIFYRYREGDDYDESFPGREAEGVVEARRVLVITRGELRRIITDSIVLTRREAGWVCEDRAAHALHPGGAGTAARPGALGVGAGRADRPALTEITALLDAAQHAAIESPPERPLLVLGSAGSGKTTVALHRLARLAASDPARFPLSRMRLVVPEEGLARLSRRLLEPLGGAAAAVRTLDAWAVELARDVFGDEAPVHCVEPPALVSSLKRHPALYHALRERFADLAPARAKPRRMLRDLAALFADRAFLERVVAASGGDLPRSAIEETVRHTMLQLAAPLEKELRSITVAEMKQAVDGRPIWEGTPDELAGTVDLEDLPILLCLRAWRAGFTAPPIAHLVLDEAEDFSLFELYVLGRLLGREPSVTLAGDEAQQTSSSFAGWRESLATLGARDAATCRLAVSYRCPRPVAELARRLLGASAPEAPALAARDGAPVGVFHFPAEPQAHLFLAGAVRDLVAREPLASVAVIARDADTARRFHEIVADMPEARLVLRGEHSFEPGVDVTDVDSVKGLEFDYVIVPDATEEAYPARDDARRRLHVAVTRASHELWIVSSGSASPLLDPS
ncbi:MAG: ATP-binding domain-containing protein [Polyangiaceae bacterium]|nr:ATP-binding domain-containing protein [Polyangiaceae bacterium]